MRPIDRAIAAHQRGALEEAESLYRHILAVDNRDFDALHMLGVVCAQRGQFEQAEQLLRTALSIDPSIAQCLQNYGNVLYHLGRNGDAAESYRGALIRKPGFLAALVPLVSLWLAEGKIGEALDLARQALATNETLEMKSLIGACLRSPSVHPGMGDLRDLSLRALSEPWAAPSDLAPTCARFLVLNDAIRDGIARAEKAWPNLLPPEELIGPLDLAKLAEDRLFLALLESTPLCEVGLERFATGLRFNLLAVARAAADGAAADGAAAEPVLSLYCAIARQCFINDYVFAQSVAEIEAARVLCDALIATLASGAAVSALWLVAVAAYTPLHTLPGAESLLDRPWPDTVTALLAQQVRAPIEERLARTSMPALTAIDDDVSAQVRSQYEENPYPKWVKVPNPGKPETLDSFIRATFPRSPFVELGKNEGVDVLVAGCGTGLHPIGTALKFQVAQVLAVDLSLTSLCYAQRQTHALGLNTIEYAQADILKLPSIGRTFDLIETSGVLHHLADPLAGWRALLLMLRPGGVMWVGLYSEIARRDIVSARDFIAERGYRPTAEDIRRCRQELFDCADGTPLKNVTVIRDFFTVSECRDLLFHVQEHRLTLHQIAAFIAENNLQFLGFVLDPQTRRNYARQFPGDIAMTDLAQWHRYETDNPHTFIGMYQFLVQKKSLSRTSGSLRGDGRARPAQA